jgi:hypothetical protein
VRVVGHGLEKDGTVYCAEASGVTELRDRV